MERMLKVTQSGTKYIAETAQGKIYILSERALKWNLKHVFGLSGPEVLSIMVCFANGQDATQIQTVEIELKEAV